jgi:O-antigen/teichoic acid export membrane protein
VNTAGIVHKYRESTIFKSAMALFVADAASKGANALIALLIARYLGPMLFGKYAAAASVCGLFMLITGIGFEQEFTRRGGIDKAAIPQNLKSNFTAIAITSVIAYLGISVFFSTGIYPEDVVTVGLLLGVAYVAMRFHLPFRHLCLLLNKSNITALFQGTSTILLVVVTLSIIYFKGGLIYIVSSQVIVALCMLITWFWWMPKEYISSRQDFGTVAAFVKNSIPFAISNIIWIAYFNFDTFMLSLLKSESEVGIYAGVYRIIGINYIFGYAIANTFTPLLFENYAIRNEKYFQVARKLLKTLSLIGVVLGFCLFYFSDILVLGVVGGEYVGGINIAKILSVAVFFRLLNFGLCEILTTSNRQRLRVYLEMALLLVNIILNFFLIPHYGGNGAAIATLAAEAVLFVGALYSYKKGIYYS